MMKHGSPSPALRLPMEIGFLLTTRATCVPPSEYWAARPAPQSSSHVHSIDDSHIVAIRRRQQHSANLHASARCNSCTRGRIKGQLVYRKNLTYPTPD